MVVKALPLYTLHFATAVIANCNRSQRRPLSFDRKRGRCNPPLEEENTQRFDASERFERHSRIASVGRAPGEEDAA